jgi:LDH2 family malate/lactate/ureidoglycolate dehydrogenase
MPVVAHNVLREFSEALFTAVDVPEDQARSLTDHLIESNLMGHDSHGVIRIPVYVKQLHEGSMRPLGDYKIVRDRPAACVIDANQGIGILMAYRAMEMAVERAKEHTFGAVAVHNVTHIGRLGAFPALAAERNCIGLIMLNGGKCFTAPFGGTARRLPPNPLAISVPNASGPPITLDITTSMVAGGKVQLARARGKPVPEGWLIDERGSSVTDPKPFIDEEVAMLPLGGSAGHKGYGLAFMVDAIAGGLSWAGCSSAKPTRGGKGFFTMAINIEDFIDVDEYKKEIESLSDWIKSSSKMPGVKTIYLPGEIEEENRLQAETDGIYIEETTWARLMEIAEELKVLPPEV